MHGDTPKRFENGGFRRPRGPSLFPLASRPRHLRASLDSCRRKLAQSGISSTLPRMLRSFHIRGRGSRCRASSKARTPDTSPIRVRGRSARILQSCSSRNIFPQRAGAANSWNTLYSTPLPETPTRSMSMPSDSMFSASLRRSIRVSSQWYAPNSADYASDPRTTTRMKGCATQSPLTFRRAATSRTLIFGTQPQLQNPSPRRASLRSKRNPHARSRAMEPFSS